MFSWIFWRVCKSTRLTIHLRHPSFDVFTPFFYALLERTWIHNTLVTTRYIYGIWCLLIFLTFNIFCEKKKKKKYPHCFFLYSAFSALFFIIFVRLLENYLFICSRATRVRSAFCIFYFHYSTAYFKRLFFLSFLFFLCNKI